MSFMSGLFQSLTGVSKFVCHMDFLIIVLFSETTLPNVLATKEMELETFKSTSGSMDSTGTG